ncbi:cyclase family protein [Sulfuracidifex metallicus]|uniref:cyclase family protein n=1 Tax=Sulfuracidifex metallicus TaxID=47303 RepID=UPI0022730D3A|nr:cyclase family protein [Sulfuracidifex metallicus]MCY0850646.1 hypothetical protein [Sulfuracidifex metallicus]
MILDLSLPIEEEMPFFPGDPKPQVRKFLSVPKDGYDVSEVIIDTHTCAHIDVSAHAIPNGKTVDGIDISNSIGNGKACGINELELDTEVLLIYTDTNKRWRKGWNMEKIETINENLANKIVKKEIRIVGIDSPSIGSIEVHKILLSNNVIVVENLSDKLST